MPCGESARNRNTCDGDALPLRVERPAVFEQALRPADDGTGFEQKFIAVPARRNVPNAVENHNFDRLAADGQRSLDGLVAVGINLPGDDANRRFGMFDCVHAQTRRLQETELALAPVEFPGTREVRTRSQ